MSAIQKFMFDRTFDSIAPGMPGGLPDPVGEAKSEPEAEEEVAEEEEIQPGYSEEQLEAAKNDAFEAGKQEGLQAALETIEQETLTTVKSFAQHLTELSGQQQHANTALMTDCIGIGTTMVRKLFPAMDEACGLGEIKRLIEQTLLRLIEEPRVVIKINPGLVDALDARLDDLKAGAGHEGRIILKEDPVMSVGDCRMEWGDGSAERNAAALWQSIDEIIEKNIGNVIPGLNEGGDMNVTDNNTSEDIESPDQSSESQHDLSVDSINGENGDVAENAEKTHDSKDTGNLDPRGVNPASGPDIVSTQRDERVNTDPATGDSVGKDDESDENAETGDNTDPET